MRSWPTVYLPPVGRSSHPTLHLFDSYQRTLVPVSKDRFTSYICGITPYDATHLGHAATYVAFDLVHRYMHASGAVVQLVENITDIDDPLFERANRDKIDWTVLAASQISLFVSDMTALHVLPPDHYEGVVENMDLIIGAVQKLIDRGFTYSLDGDLYFDIQRGDTNLAGLPLPLPAAISIFKERGGDPERTGKRHPLDALLWRRSNPGEPEWKTTFGDGRPGWHIECVALALNYLPYPTESSITLQGGGADLIFPHHYMSAIQARALNDLPFASVYAHCGMIGLDGEKMSKSKGNLVFVSKLLQAGHQPETIRMALLSRHYRSDFMWNDNALHDAKVRIERIRSALAREDVAPTAPAIDGFIAALANDLDTVAALAIIDKWCVDTEAGIIGGNAGELARALDLYLGIAL